MKKNTTIPTELKNFIKTFRGFMKHQSYVMRIDNLFTNENIILYNMADYKCNIMFPII